ncbi:MAG TPA: DUF2079 domain-containing protein [Ktedonobacterales bacterium]|nr:DUF2079 domain-containing protein [Ktedonobacterales bacterium]
MSNPSELLETLARRGRVARGHTRAGVVAKAGLLAGRLLAFLRSPRGQCAAAWGVVLLAVAFEIVVVGQRALVRYQSYSADAFDLGNMDQAVWNTLHGHPFRFTNRGLDWQGPPTRLGFHVEPILLLIAPLYLLHAGPETLIVLQTGALALGAVPLFALALRHLPAHPWVAAALAGAYLATPALLGAALWDFHPITLATPLLVAALWALDTRRYGWFVVAAALAALTKEDVALSLIPLGVYLAVWQGKPRLGWGVALAAFGWTALCFLVILPHFNDGASGGNNYWYRYAWAGDTPGAAIANVLTHPWLPFQYVLDSAERRGYLALLLRIGGGFGLLAPALWLCALPELAVNVLSTHFEQYSGFYQYNAMLGAYLPVAAVFGVAALYRAHGEASIAHGRTPSRPRLPARLVAWLNSVAARWRGLLARIPVPSRWIAPFVIAWLLLTSVWNLGALNPRLQAFWNAGARPAPHQTQINALLASVPPAATVAATDTLNPHLSDRYTIYLLPDPQSYTAEYAAFDIPHAAEQFQSADQRILDTMLASGRYAVVGRVESVVLLHRTGPPLTPPAVGPAS